MKRVICLFLCLALLGALMAGCEELVQPTDSTGATENTTPNQTQPSAGTQPSQPQPPIGEAKDIRIHELMPDNEKLCMGHENDWVELYNAEDSAVILDGYYLSDDPAKPGMLPLDGMQIPAGGYLVIELDDAAAFRLSADGETVYLNYGAQAISQLTYAAPQDGESMDAAGICEWPTPGFANTQEGYLSYLQGLTLPELIISEVMSSNSKLYPLNGECYDMIELYNNSDRALKLSDYCLTDKRSEQERYTFPDVTLQPGEYYVIYCSGDTSLGKNHTSFKLSADGETVYLSKGGSFVDALKIPADLAKNQSYGRVGNVPMYLDQASFGGANASGKLKPLAAPAASHASGLYAQPLEVTLSGEGDIYYTLDGTAPTTNSIRYTGPIAIDGVCTVRAFCVSGTGTSTYSAYTYVVGAEHDLPVVVVSIPQESLTGGKGVLNHVDQDYEHQAMLTLIEDGQEKFSVPFGFRLHGNDSRSCPKQNFQLRFRSEYGAGKLAYPLFEDRDFAEYNSLLLKGGSEDWGVSIMRDEVATAIAEGTGVYTQAIKPVVLYLGGEYWGVYYFRERFSDDYVASHMGVSAESVDVLSSTFVSIQNGDNEDFLALREYCETHDMSTDENYAYLTSQIDVTSLMDWYICRTYVADRDLANIRRFRSSEGDGKWRWMYFDLDWSFYHTSAVCFTQQIQDPDGDRTLMRAVLANAQGRDAFLKRFDELLDTILNEEYITPIIDSIASQIESEMPRDRERWGRSLSSWESGVQKLRDYVAGDSRREMLLADLQNYFDLTDAQMEAYFSTN